MNSHYTSRTLLNAWSRNKLVSFYDFDQDLIVQGKPVQSTFSQEGLYSKSLETFLNRSVENFVAITQQSLANGVPRFNIPNWRELRGLYLLVVLQAGRFSATSDAESLARLEELAQMREDQLDQIVAAFFHANGLLHVRVNDGECLFLPEVGFFHFEVEDPGCALGYGWAFAVPISPQDLIAVVSKSINNQYIDYLRNTKHLLMCRSVGAKSSPRVIIPPGLLDNNRDEDLVAAIKRWRNLNTEGTRFVEEVRKIAKVAFDATGIKVRGEPFALGGKHTVTN